MMKRTIVILVGAILFSVFSSSMAVAKKRELNLSNLPKSAQVAYIGIFLMNIYDLNLQANLYYADFFLWCRWKGEIDPLKELEFVNSIERSSQTRLNVSEKVLKNGDKYKIIRIEGCFFHPFALKNFPLDKQILTIQIENSRYTLNELIYLPLQDESGIRDDLDLPGWSFHNIGVKKNINVYTSNFGQIDLERGNEYCSLDFFIGLSRPLSFFLWKLMLPLIVVIISSMGLLMMSPHFTDARISLPIGALLSAVFLQQSYSASLPDLGYMVLMDKIYVVSYIMIIAALLQAIFTGNWFSKVGKSGDLYIKNFDKKYLLISVLIFILANMILILFSIK